MAKVLMFTHNDLDGVGCAIARNCFSKVKGVKDELTVVQCVAGKVEEKIEEVLGEHWDTINLNMSTFDFDEIWITDLSVDEIYAERISVYNKHTIDKFRLIDHHKTALWLNMFHWAVVNESITDSATLLLFNYLLDDNNYKLIEGINLEELAALMQTISHYDTWFWKKINKEECKDLNILFRSYGFNRFLNRFSPENGFILNDLDNIIINMEKESESKYVESNIHNINIINLKGYNVGLYYAERYINTLCDMAMDTFPNLDAIMVCSHGSTFSLRSRKTDVDLSELAKQFGGGGHFSAAGFRINTDAVTKFYSDALN